MFRAERHKLGRQLFAIGLSLALALPGFTSELASGRIYPTGKITLYRGERIVGEFKKEAPFPEGVLIATDGRCGVKIEDINLVAEDKSLFSVATSTNMRKFSIKEGTLYFAVSDMSRSLNFVTPPGNLAVLDILLNAATGSQQLKGYVAVKKNGSELGVIEGGSMIVSTHKGETMLKSGQRLILAQADLDVGAPEETEASEEKEVEEQPESKVDKEEKGGMSKNTKIIVGVVAAAAVAGGLGALAGGGGGGGGSGDGGTVSPSSPTP